MAPSRKYRYFTILKYDTSSTRRGSTVALIERASRKSIRLQTLKVGANDRSAQELQNRLQNEVNTKFFDKVMGI
jgi:hypothetical protein